MHRKEETASFAKELNDFIFRLEIFSRAASDARETLKARPATVTKKSGMPVETVSTEPLVQVRKRRVIACPGSIQRLCSRTTRGTSPAVDGPVLVYRNSDGHLFEATLLTETALLEPDAFLPDDSAVTYAQFASNKNRFKPVMGHRKMDAWCQSLRALTHREIVAAIDGWLSLALRRAIQPWDPVLAAKVQSLIEFRYEWWDVYVRLRPVRNVSRATVRRLPKRALPS